MAKSKTIEVEVAGHVWRVPKGIDDDFELVELFAAGEEGSSASLVNAVKKVVPEQYDLFREACRDDNGQVSTEKVGDLLKEIMEAVVPNS